MDELNQQIPQQTPQPNSNWLKTLSIGFGIIGIGILIGITGYFLGTKNIKPSTSTVSVSPTPTPDPTANWKTYTHSNFTLKYPEIWYFKDNPNYPGGNNVSFFPVGKEADYGYGDHEGSEAFSLEFSNDNRTLEDLKKNYYQNAINLMIGGKPAIKTPFNLLIIKPSEDKELKIVGGIEAAKPYLDQILSTFKFTP